MKYGEEEFFRLMTEVQAQGGQHLDETHDPVYHTHFTGGKTTEGIRPRGEIRYCGCNALFDIPYIDDIETNSPSFSATESIKVCAVDDGIGLWPRFQDAEAPGFGHFYLPGKLT